MITVTDQDGNKWFRVKDYQGVQKEEGMEISYHLDEDGEVWIKRELGKNIVTSRLGPIIPILEYYRKTRT